MKAILAPTDFSSASFNAVNYAAHLAVELKCNLILLNVYQLPVIVSDVPVIVPTPVELQEDCLTRLEKLKKEIQSKSHFQTLKIDLACSGGVPADEIFLLTQTEDIDFIVMGMRGAGYLKERLFGSVTTSVIKRSGAPVISVGEKLNYNGIKKIAFAWDGAPIENPVQLQPLAELAKITNAAVSVVHVITNETTETKKLNHEKELTQCFKEMPFSFHTVTNNNMEEGLNSFVQSNRIDLLVMLAKHHSVWERMVSEPHSKKMAFHTLAPLMVIH